MNTRTLVIAVSGMLSLAVAAVAVRADAELPLQPVQQQVTVVSPMGPYAAKALTCKNPGSQQDVAKEPILVNTTGATLAKGSIVFWYTKPAAGQTAEKGQVELSNALAPGGSIQGHGNPGNGYQCGSFIVL